MKLILISSIILSLSIISSAQSLENLSFGTDSTLDIMTWNIEHFPKNGETTINYVAEVIKALDVDVVALQEIEDVLTFNQLLDSLEGYNSFYLSGDYASLAYVYKTSVINIDSIFEIYTTNQYWSPFPRSPQVMSMTYEGIPFHIINNHFKCCGDGVLDVDTYSDEENRRLKASDLLKEYIDDYYIDERVIVLGDLNDEITDVDSNNVFQSFLNDSLNYSFVDMNIALSSSLNWSYPAWPSHLDHILVTNKLFGEINDSSDVECVKVEDYLGGWSSYDYNVSDHRPIVIRIKPDILLLDEVVEAVEFVMYNYPNPFQEETKICFNPVEEESMLEIYNVNGQKIYSEQIQKGLSYFVWDSSNYENGIYFTRLISESKILATSKMILLK